MESNPIYTLPLAVEASVNVSNESQLTTAEELINDVGSYLPLEISWSTQLTADENTYYDDTMSASLSNPSSAAKTAADYAEYTEASSEMSTQTGELSNLIQSEKTAVSFETNNVKQEYASVTSLTQYAETNCMLLRLKQ
jgi:hypothetical protein